MSASSTYRCIDLFAGIGGIRKGFELAAGDDSLETVFVSEYDKFAATTYAANFETPSDAIEGIDDLLMDVGSARIYGDITKVLDSDLERIRPFDICLAGFPCQAFSQAGKRKGFEDDYKGMARGTLFRELIRICEINRPKVVFCENVKGLLGHDGGETFKVICGAFDEAGYEVFYDVLNSSNFDVPQNRERLYIVAFRKEIAPKDFVFPKGAPTEKRIKDIFEQQPVASRYYLSTQYLETLKKHRRRHEEKGNGFGYQVRGLDELAGTLSCGGMGRERNLLVDDRPHETGVVGLKRSPINSENVRKMTPREWARLQGFPNTYKLPVADSHLYKQLGNTVTITVIQAIAAEVFDYLDKLFNSRKIGHVRKRKIIDYLAESSATHEELLDELAPLFLSSEPDDKISKSVSNTLQAMKRKGQIETAGKTASAVWHIASV